MKPACSRRMRSTVAQSATPSSTMRRASVVYPRPAWLTMKPGVSCARTGVWPMARTSASSRSHTAMSVRRPGTISTTFISGAGLKKCSPAKRSGCCSWAASAVTDSDEVLVASTAWAGSRVSRSANRACLASARSTMASTTRSQPASADRPSTACSCVVHVCACAALMRSRAWDCCQYATMVLRAASAAPGCASSSTTRQPACAASCAIPRPMAPAPTTPTVEKEWFVMRLSLSRCR